MGTFAASAHLQGVSLREARAALKPLALEYGFEFSTTTGKDWLSVHADELRYAGEVDAVAKALSSALGAMSVSFALFDDSDLRCEVFVKGRSVASATMKQGKRARLVAKDWSAVGASAKGLALLSRSTMDDATEAAFILASSLDIPEDTVLADEGEDSPEAAPRKKPAARKRQPSPAALSDALVADWKALEQAARAVGVAVPRLEVHLKLQGAFGQRVDEAAVRSTMALLKKTLPKAAKFARKL
jgi:hypothetical protein